MKNIELNQQFLLALNFIEKGANIFITGKAGTGKSTLLSYLHSKTDKNIAVIAPTGVAAVNVGGQTIHSFFRFRPDITIEKVKKEYKNRGRNGFYKKLDAIIIDEISMVRADLLDCIDAFLKIHGKTKHIPFGGVQMIFIGDLYQLPPVVVGPERDIFKSFYASPYFFSAKAISDFQFELVELEKIYRQTDLTFINLLNAVRNRSITDEMLTKLNSRLDPDFEPKKELYMYLTTTNAKASSINLMYLSRLSGKEFVYEGGFDGKFDIKSAPADVYINIKIGAQVMLVNNDRQGRWINGTVGQIVKIKKDQGEDVVYIRLQNGKIVDVVRYRWEMYQFGYNEKTKRLTSEIVGSFTQYPLILAWAITIHKSQGKTFEKVILDMDRGAFAHGQTYVALSRCVSFEGLILKTPIKKSHILLDWSVVRFLTDFQYKKSNELLSTDKKSNLIAKAIKEKTNLEIIYLKSNDQKSKRIITPNHIGQMEYLEKKFLGVSGYDYLRKTDRTFRVDKILEIKNVQ